MVPGETRTTIEIIRKAIGGVLQDVHVAMPGKVVHFDPATNLADVDIQVEHSVWDDDNERTYEDIGVLPGVPVCWPRAGGFCMTFPLTVGDTGLLVFCSTPIGEWRATGQKSQPQDDGRHSIGWPVFYPGLSADVHMPPAAAFQSGAIVIGSETGTGQVVIKNGEVDIGQGATDFVALASQVMTALNKIQSTFDSHTHAYVTSAGSPAATTPSIVASTGTSTTPTPLLVGTLASVAATIAKAK